MAARLFRHVGVPKLAMAAARGDRRAVEELCLLLLSRNRRAAQAAREVLSMLPAEGREVCCDQLFLRDNQPLANLCSERGYLPREPNRRALFWALTGDFSSLSVSFGDDFPSAVAKGYLAAGWTERTRVIRTLVASGRTDLLIGVLSEADGRAALPARTLSLMAGRAAAQGDYEWLAGRLFSFPPAAAHTASRLLKYAGFLPADGDPGYWEALYAATPEKFEQAYPPDSPPSPLAGGRVHYNRMAVNPEGTVLAAGCYDGTIEIWEIPGRGILHTISTCHGTIRSLEFSTDGTFLACGGSDGKVLIINPQDGAILREFHVAASGISALCWLPGQADLVAGGSGGSLALLSAKNGTMVSLRQSSAGISTLAAGKDGWIFSGHTDGTVWSRDPDGKRENRFASCHRGPVLALACGKNDAFLVSGSPRGSFLVHSLETFSKTGGVDTGIMTHTAMAIAPGGTWCAAGSGSGNLGVWSLPDGREMARHQVHRSGVRALAPTPDGDRILAGTGAGFLHVLPVQGSGSPEFMKGAAGGVFQLAAAGRENLVSLGWQGIIEVRALPDGGLLQRMEGRRGAISCIGATAGAGLLGVASPGGLIRLWDPQTQVYLGSIDSYLPSVNALALLEDGSAAVVAGGDGSLLILRVADGSIVRQLLGHRGSIHALALHPDDTLCAAGGWDAAVHLHPISGEDIPVVLSGHGSPVTGLSFSPGGDFLVSGSQDRTLRLWDLAEERELAVLKGHSQVVSAVAISPDGRMAASGSWDRTLRLWSLCDAGCFAILKGHKDRVTSLAFCGTDILASGDEGGQICFWTLPDGDLIRIQESSARVAGLAVLPDRRHLLSAHRQGLCLSWPLPWTRSPQESSPDDLDRVREYLRISRVSGDPRGESWKFIEMLMAGSLRSAIGRCPEPPPGGGFEIEIARGPS